MLIAVWGGVVLVAFGGWGALAARLAPQMLVDNGLRLAWGMAMLLAMGGVLTAFGLATRPAVVTVVVVGTLLAVTHRPRGFRLSVVGPMGWAAGVILALHYLGQAGGVPVVCADDHVAYWGFIERQLDLGSVDEPFSLRRLAGHGGQVFLQSLVVAEGGLNSAFLIDRGISPVIIYLLLRGALPGRAPAIAAMVITMTIVALEYEANSQSLFTGLVLFLGLARTLVALDAPTLSRSGELILLGLIVAGLSSLRVHFLLGAALTVTAWLLSGWRGFAMLPGLSWRMAVLIGSSLLFFAPWMVGLWRSSGTPLFPLIAGTGANGLGAFTSSTVTFYDLTLTYFTGPSGLFLCVPLLAIWRPTPERRVLIISFVTALVVALVFFWRFPNGDPWDFARYLWPMVVVPVLLSGIIAVRSARLENARPVVVVALLAGSFGISALKLNHDVRQLANALDPRTSDEENRLAELYRQMQDLVPVGETLLVATDNPYLIDYKRNRTWNIDLPGAASPAPGMPFFQGAAAVQDYLLAQGVHFVLFTDGLQANPCLFDRLRYTSPDWQATPALWQQQSRYIMDFLNSMDLLSTRDTVLARQDHYTLLRLNNQ